MINADKRFLRRQSQCLAGGQADQHPANQPRSGGGGYRIHIVQRAVSLRKSGGDEPVEMAEMGARRQFGHDTAIRRMGFYLA